MAGNELTQREERTGGCQSNVISETKKDKKKREKKKEKEEKKKKYLSVARKTVGSLVNPKIQLRPLQFSL